MTCGTIYVCGPAVGGSHQRSFTSLVSFVCVLSGENPRSRLVLSSPNPRPPLSTPTPPGFLPISRLLAAGDPTVAADGTELVSGNGGCAGRGTRPERAWRLAAATPTPFLVPVLSSSCRGTSEGGDNRVAAGLAHQAAGCGGAGPVRVRAAAGFCGSSDGGGGQTAPGPPHGGGSLTLPLLKRRGTIGRS
jgi:hypothetical protein